MKQTFYKIIYNPAVNYLLRNINKALYPFLPKQIKLPPSGTLMIKNDVGKKIYIKTNQTNYVTHLLFWNGYTNFEYTNIFLKLIKSMEVFYDIGANIGYYSLLAEMENKNIKVVGFEPATGPKFFYKENVRINNFKHIKVEEIALSEQEGEIAFYEIKNKKYAYLEHNLTGEGNTGSKTTSRNFEPNMVKTTTLDNYVTIHQEQNIDLIKLDTEGTEHQILTHACNVLSKMKPIVICETLFNTIEPQLETLFNGYGYEFYNFTKEGLVKVDSIMREKDNGVRDCFFVHPSKLHLIKEFIKTENK